MGKCIIQLKDEYGFRTFETEEAARSFLSSNNYELKTIINKDGKEETVLITNVDNVNKKIIEKASDISWSEIGNVRMQMNSSGFDSEEFRANSTSLSMSEMLKDIRRPDGSRLFPEFIQHNYLNVLTQNLLVLEYFKSIKKEVSDKEVEFMRHKIFDENEQTYKLTAKEFYEAYKEKLNVELSDEILNNIDAAVLEINKDNFEAMVSGEIYHKTLEYVIKYVNKKDKKKDLDFDTIIKEEFIKKIHEKYDDYPDVQDQESVINNIISYLKSNFDSVLSEMELAKNNIIKHFKDRGGNEIKFLTEKSITCGLKSPIDGKNSVRGKMDLIVLVDGEPKIIDLKTSFTHFNDWHNEKMLKTSYQLAAYRKMLENIGVRFDSQGSSTYVYSIQLNKGDNDKYLPIKNRSGLHFININKDKISENINNIFGNIEFNIEKNQDVEEDVENNIKKVFGETSQKGIRNLNKEQIKKGIKVNKNKDGITYYIYDENGNSKRIYEKLNGGTIESLIESAAEKIISSHETKYYKRYQALVRDISDYITGEKDIDEFSSYVNDADIKMRLNTIFQKYEKSECKVINHYLLEKFNIIAIDTPAGIDFIFCSSLNSFIPFDVTDKNAKLLSLLDKKIKDQNVKNVGNVNIMITLMVANEVINDFNKAGTPKTIGDVLSLNLYDMTGYKMSLKDMKSNFSTICDNLDIVNNVNPNFESSFSKVWYIFTKLVNDFSGFNDRIPKKLIRAIKNIEKELKENNEGKEIKIGNIENILMRLDSEVSKKDLRYNEEFKSFASSFSDKNKIIILKILRDELRSSYSEYFSGNRINNEVSILMDNIENAIAIFENRELNFENDISRYGWSSGAMLLSLDLIPSQNARIVNRIVNNGLDNIQQRFNKFNSKFRAEVQKLKESKGYSTLESLTSGYATRIYSEMFRKDESGELLNGDLILKNPWNDRSLSQAESRFIKFILFHMNKYKYNWKDSEYKDFVTNNDEKYRLDEVDYYVPLIRNKGFINKIIDNKNGGISMENFKSWWNQKKTEVIQMQDTLEHAIDERREATAMMKGVYNEFSSRTDPDGRKELIDKNGLSSFSRDLETAMDCFIIAMESEDVFNKNVIPTVRGISYSLQMMGEITGKEMKNLTTFIENYMKSVVYEDSIMHPEVQKMMQFVAPFKAAAAAFALSYNIVNLPRETMMGFFTNISRAMFKTYGKETFTLKDYFKAWGIMHVDAFKFIHTITKIELLNEHFRISNMSITEVPEQVTSNKTGINALFNRLMTWTITAPDYWNRMTMFIAQMIHDGTWDAYDVKRDGEEVSLIYDMSKDKRFDVLVKYKGDINNILTGSVDIKKFNEQKALYNAMREDINDENISDNISDIILAPTHKNAIGTTKWFLTKAYTNKQRDSLKSFSDITFGYYDRDVKAEFFKTAIGGTFKQFMSYLTAKKSQYFLVGTTDTARGDYAQIKNNKGEKIYKYYINSDEGVEFKTITESEYNKLGDNQKYCEPALSWTGSYMEGIVQSYVHLFKQLYKSVAGMKNGESSKILKELKEEYLKSGNIRHSNLLQLPWDIFMSTLFIKLLYAIFFDDPDKTGASYEKQLRKDSWLLQSYITMATSMAQDFNITMTMSNAVFNWDIPSLSIMGNVGRNFWRAIGDEDLTLAEKLWVPTVKSFGIFKAIRPMAYEAERDKD